MENTPVTYDRISQNPTNFESVFSRQLSLADDLRNKKVDHQQGDAEGKALHGANRTLETDLRARMFEHRIEVHRERKALPGNREQSNDGSDAPQHSRAQVTDSSKGDTSAAKREGK